MEVKKCSTARYYYYFLYVCIRKHDFMCTQGIFSYLIFNNNMYYIIMYASSLATKYT